MDDRATASKANGLHTLVNTIASPNEAFESLRETPTWGLAFLVTAVLLLIGFVLFFPTYAHVSVISVRHALATNPLFATYSDAQRQAAIDRAAHPTALSATVTAAFYVVGILISALLNALILLIPNAIAKGTADFKRLWCGSMNILVPSFGVYFLILGIVTAVRGPGAFDSMFDVYRSVPGLSWLAPGAHGFVGLALATVSVFGLWGLALNIVMMRKLAGLSAGFAWVFPVIITLLGAAFAGASSFFNAG